MRADLCGSTLNESVRLKSSLAELSFQEHHLCGSLYHLRQRWDLNFFIFEKRCAGAVRLRKMYLCGQNECGRIQCGSVKCTCAGAVRAKVVRLIFSDCAGADNLCGQDPPLCGSKCAGDTCAALTSKNQSVRLDHF